MLEQRVDEVEESALIVAVMRAFLRCNISPPRKFNALLVRRLVPLDKKDPLTNVACMRALSYIVKTNSYDQLTVRFLAERVTKNVIASLGRIKKAELAAAAAAAGGGSEERKARERSTSN